MTRTERRETLARLINLHHLMDEADKPTEDLISVLSTEAEEILPGAGRLFRGDE